MAIDNATLQAVEDLLLSTTASSVPLLRQTTEHILQAGGKRIRPRLVLLSYAACQGQTIDDVVPLAAAVEIIHTATLVHDDINDRGTLRRGRETVNARWGGTSALLTGDFMFTKTYEIMAPFNGKLNAILAQAAIELVEGETLQIEASKQGTLDRDTYFEIIAKKTAALFVACARLGSTTAGAPAKWIEALSSYAFNLGLAFQITDDLLDLIADPEQLGKNAGIDLSQGRGIAAVYGTNNNHGDGQQVVTARGAQAYQVATFEAGATPDTAPGPFKESVLDGHSLDSAIQKGRDKARELATLAAASLDGLPASPALDELRALAQKVIKRDR